MTRRLREVALPLLLLIGGLGTHLVGLGHPAVVVWDEMLFEGYAQGYLDRSCTFDIHPPLGKLLIAGSLKAAGAPSPAGFDFQAGKAYPPGYPHRAARFLPALAGALTPLLIYLVARALAFSKRGAFLAGGLVLLENALICSSRLAMIDAFLHFFIFAAFLAFLHHRRAARGSGRGWALLVAAGLLGGCAVSLKWTGIGALGVIGAATLTEAWERRDWRIVAVRGATLGISAAAVYLAVFAIHLALLTKTGPGIQYLSPEFCATIEGTSESKRPEVPRIGFVAQVRELNAVMYRMNVDQPMTHPESSRWPEWLAGRKRICFWSDPADRERRIFLAGNPVVWAFATISVAAAFWFLLARGRRLRELMAEDPSWRERIASLEFLVMAWLVYIIPFAAISRPMFLYHYFSAYLAAILLGAFVTVELAPAVGWRGPLRRGQSDPRRVGALLAAAAAAFIVVAPVTYGFRPFLALQSSLLPIYYP